MSIFSLLLAVIELSGVTGSDLRARAFFDANNVRVGDPLVLTVDFLGEADFSSLHPPKLAKEVNQKDWKIDDISAKTDTYRDAKRLIYRTRPMREGLLWFPALEFEFVGVGGEKRIVRANAIPVHAKAVAQVVVEEVANAIDDKMPQPIALVMEAGVNLSDDEAFEWRRACAKPSVEAFARFDFPAAKLNEARVAIENGEWARAMKIYRRLEWTTGQTEAIERGMIAALALKYDSPRVELPIWRQIGRPILKYDWRGRVGIVFGGFLVIAFLFWLISRGINAIACFAFLLVAIVPLSSKAGIFEEMEERMRQMRERMNSMSQGFGFQFGENYSREAIMLSAKVEASTKILQVGAPFEFIFSIEAPKTCTVGQIQITPSEIFGMTVVGQVQNLPEVASTNPSNKVLRLSVPVRYDVPFKGEVAFKIDGMVSQRVSRNEGRFVSSFSNNFTIETDPVMVNISPLDGQPEGFSGIVSEGLGLFEYPDILQVETNDVVTITYKLIPKGYVPKDFLPSGAAFEWVRSADDYKRPTMIEYKRYFVADGSKETPLLSVIYYDPSRKEYKTLTVGGTKIKYKTERSNP